MKVGIVTYYKAINNGAFLQAYCLKKFLETEFDAEVCFIRYSNSDIGKDIFRGKKNPLRLLDALKRYLSIHKAQIAEFKEGENDSHYESVVVGSDEMWNINNSVFTMENLAINVKAQKYLTYAVSMGNTKKYDAFPPQFEQELHKFNSICVRDINSQQVLREKYNVLSEILFDPVFLYDIPGTNKRLKNKRKYIMVYGGITKKSIYDAILQYAQECDLEVISVDSYNKWCRTVTSRSPFEFVEYIRQAEYVVTSMFHGTMYSIILHKKFLSIMTEVRENKMMPAVINLGVTDHVIKEKDFLSNPGCISEILNNPLDETEIERVIAAERIKTKNYFRVNLVENK